MMEVVFRADASLEIGTGHVMRCLTLANELKAKGAQCQFICREHSGNLIELIRQKGYFVNVLPSEANTGLKVRSDSANTGKEEVPGHARWLGSSQQQDAALCTSILSEMQPDWLIVDHYALEASWESALKPYYRKLVVIDDLADRRHICDLLLDQTFGRSEDDYKPWVPADCTSLCGSQYSLLRPEFSALRPYSLMRRDRPILEHLLITMGGVDKDNATGLVLQALRHCALPPNCRITVVMGGKAPWLADVRKKAEQLPWPTKVLVDIEEMAQLMADSDLAIGAAGSTSWERCCLGVPTLMVVLADNQKNIADALQRAGAAMVVGDLSSETEILKILAELIGDRHRLVQMSAEAKNITDGLGAVRLISYLSA